MFRAVIFSLEEHHPYRSLGAHRIASFLRQHGWNIEVINYANHFSLDELQTIFRQRYDENLKFIGASCNFGTFSKEFDIYCNWIKENFPHIKILVGGQYLPEMMTNAADYFITGYGENAMLVLLKYLFSNGSSVKFTIVNGKKVVDGSVFYPSAPMKSLYVEYEPRDYLVPEEWTGVEMSRGCKFECPYCNFPILGVKGDYTRDAEDYKLQLQKNFDLYGISKYLVADETFNDTTEKIIKFADATEKLSFQPYLSGFIRADLLVLRKQDREHLARMRFLGHFYGVESMNQETSKVIGKGIKTDRLQDGLLEIGQYYRDSQLPFRATIALVVGLPKETVQSQQNTFDWLKKHWLSNQSTLVWGLEIPAPNSTSLKPSKMSMDLPKYGYKMQGMENTDKHWGDFHTLYSDTIAWENENFNHITAKEMANDFFNSINDINLINNFGLSQLLLSPEEAIEKRILYHEETEGETWFNRVKNLNRYKNLKLNQ
jgi:radical SAM superfamily enzyme YgiQ (UPF0313 family)